MNRPGYPSSGRPAADLRPPPPGPGPGMSAEDDGPPTVGPAAVACPVCGAISGEVLALAQPPALLAVCDVLVIRALEVIGKRIVRVERSRYQLLGTRPAHLAHTLWQPDQRMINKALVHAWDVVPAMLDNHGCCGVTSGQVTAMLDEYVRDLLLTGRAHSIDDLTYRMETRLGLELPGGPDA